MQVTREMLHVIAFSVDPVRQQECDKDLYDKFRHRWTHLCSNGTVIANEIMPVSTATGAILTSDDVFSALYQW